MDRQVREKARHVFTFNPKDFGSEELVLTTVFIDNDDSTIMNQELRLQSNCNHAAFRLCGTVLTPELLRRCADSLEKFTKFVSESKPEISLIASS